jgi:hypothetical protein
MFAPVYYIITFNLKDNVLSHPPTFIQPAHKIKDDRLQAMRIITVVKRNLTRGFNFKFFS